MTGLKDHYLGDDLFAHRAPLAPLLEYPDGIPEDVCDLFEELALQVWGKGYRRYSSDALLHRIRWHHQIERGDSEFKINDHFSSVLARWFLAKHRECDGFFELRKLGHERQRAA